MSLRAGGGLIHLSAHQADAEWYNEKLDLYIQCIHRGNVHGRS